MTRSEGLRHRPVDIGATIPAKGENLAGGRFAPGLRIRLLPRRHFSPGRGSKIPKKRLQSRAASLICGFKKDIMAEVANKYAQNVAGKFYVDDQCIDCDLCRETAPANFTRDDDGGHSYVYKQPESPEEEALCQEAMDGCPVEAIGNDGE